MLVHVIKDGYVVKDININPLKYGLYFPHVLDVALGGVVGNVVSFPGGYNNPPVFSKSPEQIAADLQASYAEEQAALEMVKEQDIAALLPSLDAAIAYIQSLSNLAEAKLVLIKMVKVINWIVKNRAD